MSTPQPKRSTAHWPHWVFPAMLLMAVGGSGVLWRTAHMTRAAPPPRETFTATELAESHRSDGVAFRARHEGRRIRVVGLIDENKLTEHMAPEVTLRGAFHANLRPRFVFHPDYEELLRGYATGHDLAISCVWPVRKTVNNHLVLVDCELDP